MPSFFRTITHNKFPVLLLVSTAAILAGMYFLNDIVLAVRMMELDGFLKRINREMSQVDELGMVSKYKLHLQLHNREIDDGKFDDEELATVYLATSYEVRSAVTMAKYTGIAGPVVWLINLFRIPLGKAPIEAVIENPSDTELALAYYFERNKRYKHALSIYEKAVTDKLVEDDKLPIVLLHQGYCRSLIGEYDAAKSIFIAIIKNYDNENIAITAALMLRYLETIRSEVDKVKASGDTDIVKSEKLYRLIAYQDAIEVLEKIQPQNDKEAMQIAFLNARCLEETGKKEESVRAYQDIIEQDRSSDAAKAANRRLLVMASVDDEGQRLKELAKKNDELIDDDHFDALLATSDKIDRNREQLDPADKQKRADGIIEAELRVRGASAEDAGDIDTFIDDAIESVEVETASAGATIEATEEPTPGPTIEPVKKPAATRTPAPTATPFPTPGKPYSKIYKDSKGVTYKTEMYDADGRLASVEYQDGKGTVYKIEMYGRSGTIEAINYTDAKGNINKVEMYDGRGSLQKTITYEFDENGNPVKIKVFDRNGRLLEDR